jgi:hypothetical protein
MAALPSQTIPIVNPALRRLYRHPGTIPADPDVGAAHTTPSQHPAASITASAPLDASCIGPPTTASAPACVERGAESVRVVHVSL